MGATLKNGCAGGYSIRGLLVFDPSRYLQRNDIRELHEGMFSTLTKLRVL